MVARTHEKLKIGNTGLNPGGKKRKGRGSKAFGVYIE